MSSGPLDFREIENRVRIVVNVALLATEIEKKKKEGSVFTWQAEQQNERQRARKGQKTSERKNARRKQRTKMTENK